MATIEPITKGSSIADKIADQLLEAFPLLQAWLGHRPRTSNENIP